MQQPVASRAVLLWLPPFGLLGAHHAYLGRPYWAILYFLTLGLFGIGWLIDLFRLHILLKEAKSAAVDPTRPIFHTTFVVGESRFKRADRPKFHDAFVLGISPLGLLFGAHHWYLGNYGWGLLYTCTCGLLTLGWLHDIITMATLVVNAQREWDAANGMPKHVDDSDNPPSYNNHLAH